jgi:hypothetical protein
MSKIAILIVSLSVLQFIAGCQSTKSPSYKRNSWARYEMENRLPQLTSIKHTSKNISGGYYLTYFPSLFTEPDNVRESRHRYLSSKIEFLLHRQRLVPAEFEKAEYHIRYSYYTMPSFEYQGTFEHSFSLDIFEREEGRSIPTKKAWEGRASIRRTTSSDITLYFDILLQKMFQGFPEPQNTMLDFLKSLKE